MQACPFLEFVDLHVYEKNERKKEVFIQVSPSRVYNLYKSTNIH